MGGMMELHYVSIAGLALIAVSWLLQYQRMSKGKTEVTREFALLQAAGIAFLIFDAFSGGLYDFAAMNMITCGGALLVLSKAKK